MIGRCIHLGRMDLRRLDPGTVELGREDRRKADLRMVYLGRVDLERDDLGKVDLRKVYQMLKPIIVVWTRHPGQMPGAHGASFFRQAV